MLAIFGLFLIGVSAGSGRKHSLDQGLRSAIKAQLDHLTKTQQKAHAGSLCGGDTVGDGQCHVSLAYYTQVPASSDSITADLVNFGLWFSNASQNVQSDKGKSPTDTPCPQMSEAMCKSGNANLGGVCWWSQKKRACYGNPSSFPVPGMLDKYGCEDSTFNAIRSCWERFVDTDACPADCRTLDDEEASFWANMVDSFEMGISASGVHTCFPNVNTIGMTAAEVQAKVEKSVTFRRRGNKIIMSKFVPSAEFSSLFGEQSCKYQGVFPMFMANVDADFDTILMYFMTLDTDTVVGEKEAQCQALAVKKPTAKACSSASTKAGLTFMFSEDDFVKAENPFSVPVAVSKKSA